MAYIIAYLFYNEEVRTGLSEKEQLERNHSCDRLPFPRLGVPLMYVPCRGEEVKYGNSRVNREQCRQAVSGAVMFVRSQTCAAEDLVIVTPYKGNS